MDVGIDGLVLGSASRRSKGVGDQFNLTNNLNADDLEDPLLFGDRFGNVMVGHYAHSGTVLAGVLVPVRQAPARHRDIALGLTDRIPVVDDRLRREPYASNAPSRIPGWPTVVSSVSPVLPDSTLQNMQWQARVAAQPGMQDVALSYYDGRFDFPVATGNHGGRSRAAVQFRG